MFFKVFVWFKDCHFLNFLVDHLTLFPKTDNMTCLLINQMGKFYELFEMDAHVGAKELDLQYMKVVIDEGKM